MKKKSRKIEYYILAGDKGMKELLIEKEINISPMHLLIVSEDSEIGKLIRRKIKIELKKKFKPKKQQEKTG